MLNVPNKNSQIKGRESSKYILSFGRNYAAQVAIVYSAHWMPMDGDPGAQKWTFPAAMATPESTVGSPPNHATLRFVPPPARSRCATPQMPAFALPPTPATRVRPAPGVLLVGRPQTNTRSQYFPPQRPIPGEARRPHYCHQVKHKDKQIHPSETIQAFYQLIYDSGIKL